MTSKTCGRATSCDLVVEHQSVSGIHALIQLADDGLVYVQDHGSKKGTFLNRNDSWIRVRKVTLCIGDRIRLADTELPLEQLLAVFGHGSNARLEARHFPFRQRNSAARPQHKPRRNPETG